jgi:nitrous oxide reductase accessory protein NosL
MTRNAKWAFQSRGDADKFVGQNGGKAATFDEALNTAFRDMGDDTKMIRDRWKMQRLEMEHKP